MKARKPILWNQGLFVKPQHFQQNDLYFQSLLRPLQTHLHPFFWGVCKLNIQDAALKNKSFDILEGEFIFHDGTWVILHDNALFQPRSFKDAWAEPEKPFKVYLGLRRWNHKGENATLSDEQDIQKFSTRFVSGNSLDEVADLYQSAPSAQVKSLDYMVKIFWEGELEDAGNFMFLPIAELVYNGQETVLSNKFVPPSVSIAGSRNLMQIVRTVRDNVLARCHILEEYKIPRGVQFQDLEPNYLSYFLALTILNRYVPALNHIAETPQIHPWDLYGLLRGLIGELSSFTDRIDATGCLKDGSSLLPPYDHENPGFCFGQALTLLQELLSSVLVGAEHIIRLVRDRNYFSARIGPEILDSRNKFYLLIRSSIGTEQIRNETQRLAKISSIGHIPTLIQRALPGLEMEEAPALPPGVPKRPDSVCFRLNRNSDQGMEILKSQDICMYWNGAPEDLTAELVVVK
ncbi:MAG: type VI secretion system baseplate subunit TssK [Syntrophaceae bacterium]